MSKALLVIIAALALNAQANPIIKNEMSVIAKAYKNADALLKGGGSAASVTKEIDAMVAAIDASKSETPDKTATLPSDQRDAFVKGYLDAMMKLADQLQLVKSALGAGDTAQAITLWADVIPLRNDGHTKYKKIP